MRSQTGAVRRFSHHRPGHQRGRDAGGRRAGGRPLPCDEGGRYRHGYGLKLLMLQVTTRREVRLVNSLRAEWPERFEHIIMSGRNGIM